MKNWRLCNKSADFEAIEKTFNISGVTARVLVNRGFDTIEKVKDFYDCSLSRLGDPRMLKDSTAAAGLLYEALGAGNHIRIIGDYDVDGVSSTYVLHDVLEKLADCKKTGAKVSSRIPNRVKDGYGMNMAMVDEANDEHVDLIITCDNGIAAFEEIRYAKSLGMKVIVTDHHEIPERIPEADAVVDPKQTDCDYPFKDICGAVVAAYVCEVFAGLCTPDERSALLGDSTSVTERYIVNLAMATVCDVCPLTDENRIIVKLGLKAAGHTDNLGLGALIRECGLAGSEITTYHLGFVLGPCFNATGRLDVADRAFELLDAKDEAQAAASARTCTQLNEERKSMTAQWLEKAVETCERKGLGDDHVLVVFLDGCHESLAGIIAGRLRERYSRPAIVLTRADEGVKGSGRSIEAYNMFEEISRAGHLLTKFGGHPMAAGLSMKEENIDAFRKLLNEEQKLTEDDLTEKLLIDAKVPFGLIDERVIEELKGLEPFGTGMRKPVFAEKDLKILKTDEVGRAKKFLKFRLLNAQNRVIDAIYFGDSAELKDRLASRFGDEAVSDSMRGRESGMTMTVAYYPEINEYMGMRTIQMKITDVL